MSSPSLLDNAYNVIIKRMMKTGQAPHYTEIAAELGMKIIGFNEDEEVIEKILKHLGLWNVKARPPPEVKVPPVRTKMDYSDSQVSSSEWFYPHPDYPVDSYMRSRLN